MDSLVAGSRDTGMGFPRNCVFAVAGGWAEIPRGAGGPRPGEPGALLFEAVLLDLIEELTAADAEQAGGAGAVPVLLRQGLPDHAPLRPAQDLLQPHRGRQPRLGPRRRARGGL